MDSSSIQFTQPAKAYANIKTFVSGETGNEEFKSQQPNSYMTALTNDALLSNRQTKN